MLTSDVRFEGWTAQDWSRFLHLWKPRASPEREETRPRGGVFIVHDGSRIRKMLHTKAGRIAAGTPWPVPLADLAAEHHASWALAAHVGALDEIMERFGARVRREDDITAQALLLVSIVREMMAEGAIASWPHRLRGVPPPTQAMVSRTLDSVCPQGGAILLGMFKDEELWTSFAARRRGGGFDVIAGPDELRPMMGLLSGDWRRDYRHLVRAVEERYAPVAFGCFAELEAFRDLQIDARPGAWTRAVAVRDVILSPIPTAVGIALGVDGARYALDGIKALTSRFLPLDIFDRTSSRAGADADEDDPLLKGIRDKLGAATGKDVPASLGFDPMAALRSLLRR